MRVMFAHDHRFVRDNEGRYYSGGQFPYRIWQRYLDAFDEVLVAGRSRSLESGEQTGKLDLSSGPRVSFLEIPNLSTPLAFLTTGKEASRLLETALRDCDALIIRGSEIGHLAARTAERLHKPWAFEVVSCPFNSLWNYGTWQGRVYAPFAALRTRRLIGRAPFALYVTRQYLQRRYPCAGRVVSCSNVQVAKSPEQVLRQRLEAIRDGDRPADIGMIASLSGSHKGIDTALQALRHLKDRQVPARLNILGGGDPAHWKRMAEELGVAGETVFHGTLPAGAAVDAWLDTIDLYIQPSFAEGLPRALVEAMNRACPALGSSVGGIPELLDDGCLHRPGNSKALAALLIRGLEDRQWRLRQAERNFREAARYDKVLLDETRRDFWAAFAEYCRAGREEKALQPGGEMPMSPRWTGRC